MSAADVDVSVVIVNWNTRDLLLDAIASLKATTHETAIEIIVVDNDSHDDSVAAVGWRHPDVRVIRNPANLGFARANNVGFAVAKGRAFCLVNTDVIAEDGVLDRLWRHLATHPDVGVVGPRTLNREGQVRQNCRRFPSLRNAAGDHLWLRRLPVPLFPGRALPPATYRRTHDAEVLSGCFLMVRREAFDVVGPLDEDFFFYGEDTDWARRFHDAGWRSVFLAEASAIHYGGGSTAAYPLHYYLIMEKSDLLYWRKHHPAWQRSLYVAIRVTHNVLAMAGWAAAWAVRPSRRGQASLKVRGNAVNTVWLLTRRSLVPTSGWS